MTDLKALSITNLFYELSDEILSEEELAEVQFQLTSLYRSRPITYITREDFLVCKRQLLTLLDHIIAITNLSLFTELRKKVLRLHKNSEPKSMQIFLKRIKEALENHIVAIQKNHHKVDKTRLNNFIVNLCDSGAESNVMMSLTYFRLTSIEILLVQAKRNLIYELALRFIREENLLNENESWAAHIGDEVHYANGLFNGVAARFNLSQQVDIYVPRYESFKMVVELFSSYLDEYMTASNVLATLISNLPPPVTTILNSKIDIEKFNKGYAALKDFFELWGFIDFSEQEYGKIYEMVMLEDELEIRPKPFFEKIYSMTVAQWLEERGILSGVTQIVDGIEILNDGQQILTTKIENSEEQTNKYLTRLTRKEIFLLYFNPIVRRNIEFQARLIEQLEPDDLLEIVTEPYFIAGLSKENWLEIRKAALTTLFQNPSLPEEILFKLESCLPNKERVDFYYYVLNHSCECFISKFRYIVNYFPLSTQMTLFFNAVKNNFHFVVDALLTTELRILLEQESHINQTEPVLYMAAKYGATDVIKVLIAHGFSVDDTNNWKKGKIPPLYVALVSDHHQAALALVLHSSDVRKPSCYDVFNFFGETKNALEFVDSHGDSLLAIAVKKKHSHVIELLLDKKVDPNKKNHQGNTPLLFAVQNDQKAIVTLLINDSRVNPNVRNHNDLTPLILAIKEDNLEMLKILLSSDAVDINQQKKNGETPLFEAINKGNLNIISCLLRHGANPRLSVLARPSVFEDFAKRHSSAVVKRMENWLATQPQNFRKIAMSPIDFAMILEKIEIAALLSKFLNVPIHFDNERKETITCCSFF